MTDKATALGQALLRSTSTPGFSAIEVQHLLEGGADVTLTASTANALYNCAKNNDAISFRLVYDRMKQDGHPLQPEGVQSLLVPAAVKQNREIFDLVLPEVDVNQWIGTPPLYFTMQKGEEAARQRKILLEKGADPLANTGGSSNRPLLASDEALPYFAELLPYCKDQERLREVLQSMSGRALQSAVKSQDNALLETIFETGVTPKSVELLAEVIYDVARGKPYAARAVELFLQHGADVFQTFGYGDKESSPFKALLRSMFLAEKDNRPAPELHKILRITVDAVPDFSARLSILKTTFQDTRYLNCKEKIRQTVFEELFKNTDFVKLQTSEAKELSGFLLHYAGDSWECGEIRGLTRFVIRAGVAGAPDFNLSELLRKLAYGDSKLVLELMQPEYKLPLTDEIVNTLVVELTKRPSKEQDDILRAVLDRYAACEKPDWQKYLKQAQRCNAQAFLKGALDANVTKDVVDAHLKGNHPRATVSAVLNKYAATPEADLDCYLADALKFDAAEYITKSTARPVTPRMLETLRQANRPPLLRELLERYAEQDDTTYEYIGLAVQCGAMNYLCKAAETGTAPFRQAPDIMHWAASQGQHALIRTLAAKGMSLNRNMDYKNHAGVTPLMCSRDRETAEVLVGLGASLTEQNTAGQTAAEFFARTRGPINEVTQYLRDVAFRQPVGASPANPRQAWERHGLREQLQALTEIFSESELRCDFSVNGPLESHAVSLKFEGNYAAMFARALAALCGPYSPEAVQLNEKTNTVTLRVPDNAADEIGIKNPLAQRAARAHETKARFAKALELNKSGSTLFPSLDSSLHCGALLPRTQGLQVNNSLLPAKDACVQSIRKGEGGLPLSFLKFEPEHAQAVANMLGVHRR